MAKAKSIGAVHTHTHTIFLQKELVDSLERGHSREKEYSFVQQSDTSIFTKRDWKIERELQSSKIGFCCDTQKYIARYIRQKLYVCEVYTCIR